MSDRAAIHHQAVGLLIDDCMADFDAKHGEPPIVDDALDRDSSPHRCENCGHERVPATLEDEAQIRIDVITIVVGYITVNRAASVRWQGAGEALADAIAEYDGVLGNSRASPTMVALAFDRLPQGPAYDTRYTLFCEGLLYDGIADIIDSVAEIKARIGKSKELSERSIEYAVQHPECRQLDINHLLDMYIVGGFPAPSGLDFDGIASAIHRQMETGVFKDIWVDHLCTDKLLCRLFEDFAGDGFEGVVECIRELAAEQVGEMLSRKGREMEMRERYGSESNDDDSE